MSTDSMVPRPIFDAHLHIIDPAFPLVPNDGFVPDAFPVSAYRARTAALGIVGGAVVSGSFQAFDQTYLAAALAELGPSFVGVTQLPPTASDTTIRTLDAIGVRAVRFNVRRGGSADLGSLGTMARRVHELAGWHVELYVDAATISDELFRTMAALPKVVVDHLGLSQSGLPTLLRLVERGVRVKATGFGRGDLGVQGALRAITSIDPSALFFGTDLPSTRAPQPFEDRDIALVLDTLGEDLARRVLHDNAREWYLPPER